MQKSDDFSLFAANLKTATSGDIPVRLLAYLGDAVFELYQREKEVMNLQTSAGLHRKVVSQVNARAQAAMLETVKELLTAEELNLVRRARNLKTSGPRRADQSNYRRATAFEALVGYLYLTDQARLKQLLLAAEVEPQLPGQIDSAESEPDLSGDTDL